jgi:hypothetical protein
MAYVTLSQYNLATRPDLFMPWSAATALLGDEAAALAAIRQHLAADLHGPLGLADTASWATGAPAPSAVAARVDVWNLTLSTWALFQHLYQANHAFTCSPPVRAALDKVFRHEWHNAAIPSDVTGDGSTVAEDAVEVINELNFPFYGGLDFRGAPGRLPPVRPAAANRLDVSGDDYISPLDALLVINVLNAGEGEAPADRSVGPSIRPVPTTADQLAYWLAIDQQAARRKKFQPNPAAE